MEETGLRFILGKPLRGWLRKQGGVMRGWQRKYFVLQDNCLFCFNREDDTRVAHAFLLDEYELKEVSAGGVDDSDKFTFELVTVSEKSSGESLTLCAATEAERKEWMKGLCFHIYADRGGAMFGTPLEETMKYEHKHGRSVPHIVESCIMHLDSFGMDTEGIFRLAGRAGLLKELRAKFETGQQSSLDNVDVHTVGSLLKLYLRELPSSLIPPDFYQRAMNCAMRYSEASPGDVRIAEVTCMCELLQGLPDVNYTTLAYICRFLHRLAANSEKTKMTALNLSLVFGPNLIRHLDNNPELFMLTADLNQHLVFMLIEHCSEILPSRPDKESIPVEPGKAAAARQVDDSAQDSVATADLLHLSLLVDYGDANLQASRPTALGDLADLDLNLQIGDRNSENSQSSATPPYSPFIMINHHCDGASNRDKSASLGRLSLRTEIDDALSAGSGLVLGKPVPPKRTKSRTLRSRRSGAPAPPSPSTPDSPRQLDSQDILTALAVASQAPDAAAQSPQNFGSREIISEPSVSEIISQPGVSDTKPVELGNETENVSGLATSVNETFPDSKSSSSSSMNDPFSLPKATPRPHKRELYASNSNRNGGVYDQSGEDLQRQVTALKSELVSTKTYSERMVAALKNQLIDIRSKYEARIASMETQYKSKVMDLTAKLDAERNARAEAVEKTISLQSKLYRYQLQYGEMQDF